MKLHCSFAMGFWVIFTALPAAAVTPERAPAEDSALFRIHCQSPQSEGAKAICASPLLREADERIYKLFMALRRDLPHLIAEQKAWISNIHTLNEWGVRSLPESYARRTDYLEAIAAGDARIPGDPEEWEGTYGNVQEFPTDGITVSCKDGQCHLDYTIAAHRMESLSGNLQPVTTTFAIVRLDSEAPIPCVAHFALSQSKIHYGGVTGTCSESADYPSGEGTYTKNRLPSPSPHVDCSLRRNRALCDTYNRQVTRIDGDRLLQRLRGFEFELWSLNEIEQRLRLCLAKPGADELACLVERREMLTKAQTLRNLEKQVTRQRTFEVATVVPYALMQEIAKDPQRNWEWPAAFHDFVNRFNHDKYRLPEYHRAPYWFISDRETHLALSYMELNDKCSAHMIVIEKNGNVTDLRFPGESNHLEVRGPYLLTAPSPLAAKEIEALVTCRARQPDSQMVLKTFPAATSEGKLSVRGCPGSEETDMEALGQYFAKLGLADLSARAENAHAECEVK